MSSGITAAFMSSSYFGYWYRKKRKKEKARANAGRFTLALRKSVQATRAAEALQEFQAQRKGADTEDEEKEVRFREHESEIPSEIELPTLESGERASGKSAPESAGPKGLPAVGDKRTQSIAYW